MAIEPCRCLDGAARTDVFDETSLGTDDLYGESSILVCRTCGRNWLNYHLEFEAFTGSGRWYRALLRPDMPVAPRAAVQIFAQAPGYLAGGSYYDGQVHRRSGPIETSSAPAGSPVRRRAAPLPPAPPPGLSALPPKLRRIVAERDDADPHFEPHVAFSPDGSRAAFSCRSVEHRRTEVWVGETMLTEIPGSSVHPCPFWSPDGRSLGLHLVHLEEEKSAVIVVPDLKGGGEILYQSDLVDLPEPGAWSPSGRSIAFPRTPTPKHEFTKTGEPQVVMLDVASGELWPLTKPGEAAGRPCFTGERRLETGGLSFDFSIPV